ncbi:autotransporter domain-containing protein [Nordella sp. HKS 07]|uniref:autotransporter domain-containing protein n=1 Tax=Nordella sp. HKS 07 TaxID=2712222 RepID=UPI0013E1666D|nr:autotransporter domain-containing protein [Nordella sp. HKS 07]QIG47333.1 autotransporter domain-containing protein [Nordella sp. HKS 07]
MARPLIRMNSGAPAGRASRILRNRLTLTTILAMSPFLSYGRPAHADCTASSAPSYQCSGTDTDGITINEDNAQVSTLASPPFVVETGGLTITGDGNISFTDDNASSITNEDGTGLFVVSDDDVSEEIDGSLTITGNSIITGTKNGIFAKNLSSGNLAITVNGEVTGLDPDDPEIASDGIYAFNTGRDLTITTGARSVITGDDNAIEARNYGTGNLSIDIQGRARSNDFDGIFARNGSIYDNAPEADDLKITIGAQAVVDGNFRGIHAQNYGTGDLSITVDGAVTGRNRDGIQAVNEGQNLIIAAGASSVIRGEAPVNPLNPIQDSNGIDALNKGSGYLKITADGVVFGNINDAIFAKNYGTDLIVQTGEQSLIQGGGNGIGAYNSGIGRLEITANGLVGGYAQNGDGIHAVNRDVDIYAPVYNPDLTKNMSITTGAASTIRGVADGIDARNYGAGSLTITTRGEVTGKNGAGIFARNVYSELWVGGDSGGFVEGRALGLTIATESASKVTGRYYGIYAEDSGDGEFLITANGQVTGQTGDGIFGLDGSEGLTEIGGDFTIITGAGSIVGGDRHGIHARNYGSGNLKIEVNGQVTGAYEDGIYAISNPDSDDNDLTIITGPGSVVTGGDDGIDATQDGAGGAFKITVNGTITGLGEDGNVTANCICNPGFGIYADNNRGDSTEIEIGGAGLVQGRASGIYAKSRDDQSITITNDGIVRNLSALSDAYAIVATGGATEINNTGAIIGTVQLSTSDDTFNNDGLWSTTGENNFDDGGDDEVNNRGVLFAAADPGAPETSILAGLERFNNSGLVSLVDGQAGDSLVIRSVFAGDTDYLSEDGHLSVDAILGPEGKADELHIEGNVTGVTKVHVNVVDATGASEGIPVIRVFSGITGAGDFVLDGPLYAGFYSWDMRFNAAENVHELFTSGIGIGAEEFAGGMTGAQDMWFQSLGTLLGRQMDLKSLLGGTGVTPVADFGEPVAPTPVARVTPGFWFSGVGAYLERDDEQDGFILDRKQTIWGGLAGFDFGTQDVGDALLFGVFGGYLTSTLKFDETNTEWTYEGPSVGVYATYLDRAFFVDATLKVDFLDIGIDPEDLAPAADDGDTDALNIGGRIDTGYKFGEGLFVEPQASLAAVHSEIDDVDVFGGTVAFDDETSVMGRLGLRLGFDHTASDAMIYSGDVIASVWEDFSGDNNATIATPGLPDLGVSDDPGATMGDVSLGFAVASPEGWSGFLRGNYQFASDYDAYSGNAGIRYAW